MRVTWFATALLIAASSTIEPVQAIQSQSLDEFDDPQIEEMLLAQLEAEQNEDPMAAAKSNMKELNTMAKQKEAKEMGFGSYQIYSSLRRLFMQGGEKAWHVQKRLELLFKHPHALLAAPGG